MPVPSMQSVDDAGTKENTISLGFYLLMVGIMVVAFWFPDHEFNRSIYFRGIDSLSYDGTHNRTADKLGAVDGRAIVVRVSFAMLGAFFFLYQRTNHLRLSASLLWLSLGFGSMLFLSTLWSVNPKFTLFKLVVLACFAIAALGIASRFTVRNILEWITISCLLYVGIGFLAELSLGTFRPGGGYRFIGTTHPNTEAIYGSIICLCSRIFYQADRSKVLAIAIFLVGVICILATRSRTTLAATLFAMAVVQTVTLRGLDRMLIVVSGLFAAGAVAIAAMFLSSQGVDQLTNILAMGRSEDVYSLTGRLPLWEELILSIKKVPALGYGYLAYWNSDRVEALSGQFGWEIPHGHNMYLDIALDIGVFGALLFVGWLLCGLLSAANQCSRTGKVEYAVVAGIITSAIINGLGESLFKLPGFPLFILLTCMFLLCMRTEALEVVPEGPIRRIRTKSIPAESKKVKKGKKQALQKSQQPSGVETGEVVDHETVQNETDVCEVR